MCSSYRLANDIADVYSAREFVGQRKQKWSFLGFVGSGVTSCSSENKFGLSRLAKLIFPTLLCLSVITAVKMISHSIRLLYILVREKQS